MDEKGKDRLVVLSEFHAACRRPTPEDIAAWVDRHPVLGDEIRAHAEALLASVQDPHPSLEASPELVGRTRRNTLAALEAARARTLDLAPPHTMPSLMSEARTNLPLLAQALGLGRAPLVDLVKGRVRLPIAAAALAPIAAVLRTTVETLEASLATTGRGGSPTAPRRPFADIVRDDPTMSPEQKQRWLSLAAED